MSSDLAEGTVQIDTCVLNRKLCVLSDGGHVVLVTLVEFMWVSYFGYYRFSKVFEKSIELHV